MTKTWKRIAIGAAVVAGVAVIGLVARPGILQAAAGMMGSGSSSMMQGGMMQGNMNSMMNGDMSSMMNGNMADMMKGMMNGDMSQMHDTMSGMHNQELSAAAGALGMTADDLTKALADGRGVADLAKEKGVELTAVTGAMEAARKAAFDQLVTAGTMTREQADQMIDHMGKLGLMTLNGAAMMQNGGTCHTAQTQTKTN
jgi:hypothetical protein